MHVLCDAECILIRNTTRLPQQREPTRRLPRTPTTTTVRGDDGPPGRLEPFICLLYYTEHHLVLYTFTAVPGRGL